MPSPAIPAEATPSSFGPAAWMLRGATLHPGGGAEAVVADLAVTDERISFIGPENGSEPLRRDSTRVIDGRGLHVYPGLVDAHAHLQGLGESLEQVSLVGAATLAECLQRIEERARTLPPGAWVQGRGWDQNDWPVQEYPTRTQLDRAAGGRPVFLKRIDGHAAWVSSAALELAGVGKSTPDPEGGQIVRDEAGAPKGVLIDDAMALVFSQIPKPDAPTLRRRYLAAQKACLDAGLTEVHDMGVNADELAVLRDLDAQGELRIRVYGALSDDPDLWQQEFARGPQLPEPGRLLTVRAVKLYCDGALGSRGARMFEDYSDMSGHRGFFVTPPETLMARALRASRAGYQVCIHAIGDEGNHVALSVCEAVVSDARQRDPEADPRPRIEHAQNIRPADIPRFAKSGIIASMQPTHCTSDMPWAPTRLGSGRLAGAYAWKSLWDSGARLAFGSDFPIESHDPQLGLYAAVTRQAPDGRPPGGWAPRERLPLSQALAGFTSSASYAALQEADLGTLRVGRIADLTILEGPLRSERSKPFSSVPVRMVATAGQPIRVSSD